MSSLLRSTKFVRYFTGAARTLLLNSAKTAETNLLINSKALCAANNVLMRDYATKKAESLEPLLQKLDSEVRRYGRITKKDIDEVFDEIRSRNDITSSQSLLVIRCCGELVPEELPEQRTLLVQKIWSVLTERGIPMDISHYNALLRVYLENEHPFSPAQFLEELEKKGLQANRVTYQRLMWRYCQEGDVEGATKVLERMRELNLPVSEPVLNALVMGHAFHGDTDGAKAVLETMAKAGLQPTNRTYALLACGYAKKGDIEGVNSVIKQASDTEAALTDKDTLEIIEHLALGGHDDKAEQLFPHLHKNIGYNQEVYNLILRLLNKGQLATAKKMLQTMPKSEKIEDTPFKGAFFVKQLLRVSKSTEEIVRTCLELKQEGLIPNAIPIATENALIQGRSELALALFVEYEKEGNEIRPHFYWPLLAQKVKENDEEGLIQIMREMADKNRLVSGEALRDYVIPYFLKKSTPENVISKLVLANIPIIHSVRNIIIELLDSGRITEAAECTLKYQPRGNYSSMARPLLNCFSKTKDVESFVSILHVISSKAQSQEEDTTEELQKDDSVINEVSRIVTTAVKMISKRNLTEKLLTELESKGLRISVRAAENIEQYLGEDMTTQTSELLSKLTSSELEIVPIAARKTEQLRTTAQLEKLLQQFKNKEGANVNRILKQLLSSYIAENNVEKVNSHLKELKAVDFQLNNSTYAQIFDFYCQNNEVDRAKECQSEIMSKNPEFTWNKYKIILLANAMVKSNRYDEAVKLMTEFNVKEEGELNYQFNSKCWQLLNGLAENKDVAKVKEMTDLLITKNYIEPSNVILGPLIKVHLLNNDLEGALNEFEVCCKNYRCTPWKGELMKALINKEDANKLQWLADLSTQIHGEVNILHDLVLAFVECGRLRQARRILETPGLHTRHRRLDDACQRYVEEGKSEHLEGLLEATKDLSHFDRSNIFFHLLVTYCKSDETDKALGLWTLLQEDGEIPSNQFLLYLGNHLKAKKRPVPFVMPNEPAKNVAKSQNATPKETVPKSKPEAKKSEKKSETPTKIEISTAIETLVQNEQLSQAVEMTMKTLKEGIVPKPSVMKYLLKSLALQGDLETLKKFDSHLTDTLKRTVAYDDKLTLATFVKGGSLQHIDELLQSVESAKTDEELLVILRKFPRSAALYKIIDDEEIVSKCKKIAEIAASKDMMTPMNILWMEYLVAGKEKEADELWNKYLSNSSLIIFRRLLQESHVRNDPKLTIKLIECLKTNKQITKGSIGNAYSRLIGRYISEKNYEQAEKTLDEALKFGVESQHINKSIFVKLKAATEAAGKTFKYQF